MKKLFCFPALELFRCLPLWKTVLFVSSRAFLLSTPTFLLSTLYKNSEATWKKATKCNKYFFHSTNELVQDHSYIDFGESCLENFGISKFCFTHLKICIQGSQNWA